MKISEVIKSLEHLKKNYGDLETEITYEGIEEELNNRCFRIIKKKNNEPIVIIGHRG